MANSKKSKPGNVDQTGKPRATAKPESTKKKTRPSIKSLEQLDLWVASGGRCAFCNKYLLSDTFFCLDLNLAEKAHIVGWDNAPGSPRGNDSLALDRRNDAANLMLLCADHHQIIDSTKHLPSFSVERLREQKYKHEARIKYLTSLTDDNETVVIRMLGPIRGLKVELSRQHAAAVVLKDANRYPRFPLALDGQDLEIDTSRFPDPETSWDAHWQIGKATIDNQASKVYEGLEKAQIRHLSIFGFARIPLLIYLGYKLGDKVPTDIYQKQRTEDESWFWNSEAPTVQFEARQIQSSSDPKNIALIMSLSGNVSPNQLPEEINREFNIFEIFPVNQPQGRDLLKSRASLSSFTKCYHDLLSKFEQTNKSSQEIHIFPAIPISAAIACGRGIMRDAQPSLIIYDRWEETYKYALTVN